jgi:hypothetical protein
MSARGLRFRLAVPLAGLLAFAEGSALADATKDQCIDANVKAQDLRRQAKLSLARAQLRVCADQSCPTLVRDDCSRRLDELERAQPSVVFDLKDSSGTDLIDVRVRVDGQPLVDHLDGNAVNVDPGVHTFTFDAAGKRTLTKELLVREGEASRRERLIVADLRASPPEPTPPSVVPRSPSPSGAVQPVDASRLGGQKVLGLAVGGVGIGGLVAGGIFGVLASSAWNNAKSVCGNSVSSCNNVASATAYRSTAVTDGAVATVGFIAGGALLAGGAIFFFSAGRPAPPQQGLTVVPAVGRGVEGIAVIGVF